MTDEKTPDNASEAENKAILDKEGQRILAKVGDRDYVIALAIEGKQFPSEQFAKELEQATLRGLIHITFIIGGSLGLSPKVKKRANQLMSFWSFDFSSSAYAPCISGTNLSCIHDSARKFIS
ncbi:Putative cytosolic protein [Streptococcus thermophilus CNCM I-1630]|nr:Putative cytosolic protein [Streptococcus thermophilus CNCM I-1630]